MENDSNTEQDPKAVTPSVTDTPKIVESKSGIGQLSALQETEIRGRIEKLRHEIAILAGQRSTGQRMLEWLKALTGPAAVLGLIATIAYNSFQIQQTSRSRDDERFDRAVARLGSTTAAERLTGLVGLELFITREHAERHRAALDFLINILAEEKAAAISPTLSSRISVVPT